MAILSVAPRGAKSGLHASLVVLTLLLVAEARAAEDPPRDDLWTEVPRSEFEPAFRKIIDANKANWRSIRTWKGDGMFSLVDVVNAPFSENAPDAVPKLENVKREIQGRFEVVLDVPADSLFTKVEPLEMSYQRLADGAVRQIPFEKNARWTVQTGEHSLTLMPGELTGRMPNDPIAPNWNAHHSRIVRTQGPEGASTSSMYADVIDPRVLMWGSQMPIFDHWAALLSELTSMGLDEAGEEIRKSGGRGFRLDREERPAGARYRFTMELSAGRFVTVIDLAVGANIVENTFGLLDGDQLEKETKVSYSAVDGVFVPARHEVTTRDRATGGVTLNRTLTFEKQILNGEIDPATFTEKVFALRIGDRVIDQMRDEMFLVADEGRLVAPDEFERLYEKGVPGYSVRKAREPGSARGGQRTVGGMSMSYVLVAGNLILLAVIIVFIWIRRRSRRN